MGSWRRSVLVLLAGVVIGAAVPGVFLVIYLLEPRPPLPPDLPNAPCPLKPDAGPVRHPSEYTERARPYTGSGPHPVDLFALRDGKEPHDAEKFRLPEQWQPTGGSNSTDVQLVVCEYLTGTGSVIERCEYPAADTTISLVRASYTYHVYEARTGKLVTEFALDSPQTGFCPQSIFFYDEPNQPQQRIFPDDVLRSELEDQLRPIVEGTVRGHTP
jgi:hypothetical protein